MDAGEGEWGEDEGRQEGEELAPLAQMVMVGCWTSLKEASLLLGSIARFTPINPGDFSLLCVALWTYVGLEEEA